MTTLTLNLLIFYGQILSIRLDFFMTLTSHWIIVLSFLDPWTWDFCSIAKMRQYSLHHCLKKNIFNRAIKKSELLLWKKLSNSLYVIKKQKYYMVPACSICNNLALQKKPHNHWSFLCLNYCVLWILEIISFLITFSLPHFDSAVVSFNTFAVF